MLHIWVSHVAHTRGEDVGAHHSRLIHLKMNDLHICDMTHSYVRHDSFIWMRMTRLNHLNVNDLHIYDMTHSYVRHDSFIWMRMTRLNHLNVNDLHIRDMTRSYVRRDSFIEWSVRWMSHFAHMNESCHKYGDRSHSDEWVTRSHSNEWVTLHIRMSRVTNMDIIHIQMNESCRTYEWVVSQIWTSFTFRWMSHVAHTNESCHKYGHHSHSDEWVTSFIHDANSFAMCRCTSFAFIRNSSIFVTRLIHMCDMTHSSECDVTHSSVGAHHLHSFAIH